MTPSLPTPMRDYLGYLLARSFMDQPLLVVGIGRSGTSVVKDALGQHSRVLACEGEAPHLAPLASMIDHLEVADLRDYYRRSLRMPVDRFFDHLRTIAFEASMGPRTGLRRVLQEAVRGRKWVFGLRYWCVKAFPDEAQAAALEGLYPEARFIYVVRNGVEVVQSRTRFEAMRDRPFEEHCRSWAESVRTYAYLEHRADALTLRHEDLVSDPDAEFSRIAGFLGLPPEPGPADFTKTTLVHPLDEPTETDVAVAMRLRERPPGHRSWTSEERATFTETCGDAMAKLGYESPF